MVRIEAILVNPPTKTPNMDTGCKHPKVRIVAREDDVEYLECLECSEVFDSEELRDMTAENPHPSARSGPANMEE